MICYIILITGAASGFGSIAVRMLAQKGHVVYAGMQKSEKKEFEDAVIFGNTHSVRLKPITIDVTDDNQIDIAVEMIINTHGRIDVLVHNAGVGCSGPAEAFSTEQMMRYFDVNVLGAQRLNRAVLPHMRKAKSGFLLWTSSSSTRGGTPPFLGPYFATKAAMDSLAVSYTGETARWGIESSIVVPGAFPRGTGFFSGMDKAADRLVEAEYLDGPYKGIMEQIVVGLGKLLPEDAEPSDVAKAMVHAIESEPGKRPYRIHVDPAQDGAEVVSGVADRMRLELLRRLGLEDLAK